MPSDDTIPSGFCHCGCGEKTRIAHKTRSDAGWIKGEPLRYVRGHSNRGSPLEYVETDRGYETPSWIWQRALTNGYGVTYHEGRLQRAHRVYYEREHGPIPVGLEPDHLCRQRDCIRSSHLELVTRIVNARRGAKTKINGEIAREIVSLKGKMEPIDIAALFGISRRRVYDILNGNAWADAAHPLAP